jgi:hypothetical protein
MAYEAAKNSARYPDWSMIGSFEHIRPGADELYGVGSQRIYRTWPLCLLEEVTELVPERRVAYALLSGLPFRNYRSSVNIEPTSDGGTEIHWRSVFEPKIPGTGAACRAFMQSVIDRMTPLLAREAERLASSAGSVT